MTGSIDPFHTTHFEGDGLQHHSLPGVYWVAEAERNGKVVLLDPHGQRHRVWPDYVAENFTRIDPLPGF